MRIPLPEEFVADMRRTLGDVEAERLFDALDDEPTVAVRCNPLKPALCFEGEAVGWCRWGRYLDRRPLFTLDPLMHAGAYYVQEASSQFMAHLLDGVALEGCRVLDMCAAPGGKTTIYSTLVGREGLVVANDISRNRALALADNVQRWGMGNVVVTCNEPSHIGEFGEWFDVVAVDAPCSGEGMFRKMEEAREEWSAGAVDACAARQKEILAEAWRALRPGGVLMYSTCTFNTREDEGVVRWLVESYGDELVPMSDIETDELWGIAVSRIGAFQCFHFYPHRARGEGFFVAIARKAQGAIRRSKPKARRKIFTPIAKSDLGEVQRWVDTPKSKMFAAIGDTIYCFERAIYEDVVALAESLSVIYSGVAMGQLFKRRLRPEHPLALYVGLNVDALPSTELTAEDAVEYLRRGDVEASLFEEGIKVVRYGGLAIGFVKRIGARCNNMYPKELRILKQ